MDAKQLTQKRKETHGDWHEQARMADDILSVFAIGRNWNTMPPFKRQALMMLAVKCSRILSGDPGTDDHWDDIEGYAHLGKGGHNRPVLAAKDESQMELPIPTFLKTEKEKA